MRTRILLLLALTLFFGATVRAQVADPGTYLANIIENLHKRWPDNKTVNIVFHGHSVPAGYARTPVVNTLGAYPHQTLVRLKEAFPNAVINVITTAIGGEQSEQGAARFEAEVLTHRPDILFIDYALNDRTIGVERSERAWRAMITQAQQRGVRVVLLTPTPDLSENILADQGRLFAQAEMIRRLAAEYHVGLVDVYARFRELAGQGERIADYMAQVNHPNEKGHTVAATLIADWIIPE